MKDITENQLAAIVRVFGASGQYLDARVSQFLGYTLIREWNCYYVIHKDFILQARYKSDMAELMMSQVLKGDFEKVKKDFNLN